MELQPELYIKPESKIRGSDCFGSGYYNAPRGDHHHKGVDFECIGGSIIHSGCKSVVTKTNGICYKSRAVTDDMSEEERTAAELRNGLRYVELEDDLGCKVRHLYVKSLVEVGDKIEIGTPIGVAQGLAQVYPGIIDHIHFEVFKVLKVSGREYLNPIKYLRDVSDDIN